jgi:putative hydrolase
MPGGNPNNPFGLPPGFDLADLMRMLQSPGPVNMEVARSTAEATAVLDLETGASSPEPPIDATHVRAFDDVVRAVQLAVADTTGISAVLNVSAACVDRAGWARTTLAGLEPVFVALANALGRGMPGAPGPDDEPQAMGPDALFAMVMPQLVPLLLGGWAGSMIGQLSHQALGQYDLPLPLGAEPKLLFVARNVDDFAEEWALPTDELRYALALRETVHGAQRTLPWVRERLVQLASDYVGAYEVQTGTFEEQLRDVDFGDPASMEAMAELANPDMLLGALRSERQAPLLEALQRFVSVLEGYTDVVVDALGERMVPSHVRIDEALRRHRLERGEATAFVDRLLGLELDRTHYETGVAFCRGVIERGDGKLDELNRLWTTEAMLPTRAELEAPGLWLARIDLPD